MAKIVTWHPVPIINSTSVPSAQPVRNQGAPEHAHPRVQVKSRLRWQSLASDISAPTTGGTKTGRASSETFSLSSGPHLSHVSSNLRNLGRRRYQSTLRNNPNVPYSSINLRYRSPSWLVRPLAGPLDRFRRLRGLVATQRWIGQPTRRPTGLSRVHHWPHPGRLVRSGRGGQLAPARVSRSTCIADPGG